MSMPAQLRVAAVAWLAAACTRSHEPARDEPGTVQPASSGAVGHSDEAEHEELPKRFRLDPRVIRDAKIETAPVAREAWAAVIDLPGEIASDPDQTAKVSALVAGRIKAVYFKEGQGVQKNQVLALLEVPDLGKAKADFAATSAKAAAARVNAQRLRGLAERRLAANQEVLGASAEADALEAEARAAAEQLAAWGTSKTGGVGSELPIRAPIAGIIVARDAVIGQPVAPEQVLASIANLSEVWFLGSVFEKNLSQVRTGAAAEVQLNAYPKERFPGSVEYLSRQIEPAARTVTARIRLTNRGDLLRLGLYGVAHVDLGERAEKPPVLVLPRSAITEIGNQPIVFVQQPDGDFDAHRVVLGQSSLGKVEIVSGLREGERAVVQGVFTLRSVVLKGTFGEDDE
jgi:cobalt-zinc-cadmium efflux system membrane fusion protein